MKLKLVIINIVLFIFIYSCKKEDMSTEKQFSGMITSTDTLQGTFTTDTTLNASVKYILKGKLIVDSGASLIIPAGTRIETTGIIDRFATRLGTLYTSFDEVLVRAGGKLIANGTANQPVVFIGSKGWPGITIQGNSVSNPNDNSGTLQYVRLTGAGYYEPGGVLGAPFYSGSGLTLSNVGSGTLIENLFVDGKRSNLLPPCASCSDGPAQLPFGVNVEGGTVNMKKVALAQYLYGIQLQNGYQGKIQYLINYSTFYIAANQTTGIFVVGSGVGQPVNTQLIISNATLVFVTPPQINQLEFFAAIFLRYADNNNVGLPGQIKIRNSLAYSSTFAVLRVNNNSSDLSDIYPQTEIANNITVFTQSNAEQENFGSVISAGSANGSRNAFEYLARPQFGNRTVSNLSDFGFSETVTLGLKPNSIARTGASFEGADFSDPFFQNTQGELGAVTTTSGNWTLTSPWLTFE